MSEPAMKMVDETTELEQATRQEVAEYVAPISSFLVVDDRTMQQAGDTIKEINKRMKLVDEKFAASYEAAEDTKRKAEAARKALANLIDDIKAPYVKVKDYLVLQGREYDKKAIARRAEEQRIRDEAARKEEEERRFQEALAAEAEGATEEAESILQEPIYTPSVPAPKPEYKVDKRLFPTKWRARVTDKMALILFVSKNPNFVHLLDVNQSQLNTLAKNQQRTMRIPGVVAEEE